MTDRRQGKTPLLRERHSRLGRDIARTISSPGGVAPATFTGAKSSALISNVAYGAGWNGVTSIAPSKNAVYDKINAHETDDNAHHEVFENLVEDLTPQLGGPLDLNGQTIDITSVSLHAANYWNGTTMTSYEAGAIWVMLAADQDCNLEFQTIYNNWGTALVNPKIQIYFTGPANDTWTLTVRCAARADGEAANSNNLYNASVDITLDEGAAAIEVHEITTSGTISPGDVVNVWFEKTSNDTQNLYILGCRIVAA